MAITFWDSSAVIALAFNEPHTPSAQLARSQTEEFHGWDWLAVEIHAATARRRAHKEVMDNLAGFLSATNLHSLSAEDFPELIEHNKRWRLRAYDAGHLFSFQRVHEDQPELELVTFDKEMIAEAKSEGFRVWELEEK